MQKKSCRYLLSYSPGGSTLRDVGPSWRIPILGQGEIVVGQRERTM